MIKKKALFITLLVLSSPVYSVGVLWSSADSILVRAPNVPGGKVVPGIDKLLQRMPATMSGVALKGQQSLILAGESLPVQITKRLPLSQIAKAAAKQAFKPGPLAVLGLAAFAYDLFYDDVEGIWKKNELTLDNTTIYKPLGTDTELTFSQAVDNGYSRCMQRNTGLGSCRYEVFPSYIDPSDPDLISITYFYTLWNEGGGHTEFTQHNHLEVVTTTVEKNEVVTASESDLEAGIQEVFQQAPINADTILDSLTQKSIDSISPTYDTPAGPASVQTAPTSTTVSNPDLSTSIYDADSNTTTTTTATDTTTTITNYDIDYFPGNVISATPTTTTSTETTTVTNVTNNTTNITTTTTETTNGPTVITVTEPPSAPEPSEPEPEPNYSVPYSDSSAPASMDFYTQQYPDGMQGVWDSKTSEINQAPLVLLIDQFTAAPASGTCPVWSLNLNTGISGANFGTHNIAPDCSLWPIIKAIVLVSDFFASRKIIFGG